ncbi:MAG: arsenite methyltransferase [Leptospira sp.]|nr:arsenite methyltransferase [Leptospira sp.]
MQTTESIKEMVKDKYSQIAKQSKEQNESSCCGSSCCSAVDYSLFSEDYSKLEGYEESADLGLGCGVPTQFANIKQGDVVIDLGSGAGNDAFVARSIVGEKGKVIGIDMTDAMIEKARLNNEKLGFNNVEFRLGDIEKIPGTAGIADVVISNCVLNLVPDKEKAFSEIYRVLKDDGHICISDIVLNGEIPEKLKSLAEMYAGCVSGAIQKNEYLKIMNKAGFTNISIKKEKPINIPEDVLDQYLSKEEIATLSNSKLEVLSVTVYAEKKARENCCAPGCCSG